MADGLRYRIESTASDRGLLWRAEATDSYGRLADATRWVHRPSDAIRDQMLLMRNQYWADGGDPHRGWVRAA